MLVPANRFEVLECEAAICRRGGARALDGDPPPPGGLDVLAQHLLGDGLQPRHFMPDVHVC